MYSKVFVVSNFNLGFGSSATDVRAACSYFLSQVRNEYLSGEDKRVLVAEYINLHCRRQRQFYNLMNDIKDSTTVSFDMLEKIVLPRTPIGLAIILQPPVGVVIHRADGTQRKASTSTPDVTQDRRTAWV